MPKHIGFWLVMAGLGMGITEELTYKSGAGGILFGSSGVLKSVNALLPAWHVPGTKTISARYPSGIPIRLDMWLVLAGAALWLIGR